MIRYTCIVCLVFYNNISEACLIKTDRWNLCSETLAVFCQVLRFSTGDPVLSPPYMLSFPQAYPRTLIQHYVSSVNRQPLALWHPWLSF